MANRNWASGGKIYSMHTSPVLIDCNFIIDSTNGNGLGIRSLKGPTVQNVFMNTSATPCAGNSNPATPNVVVMNPNPAPGTIIIQMQDAYNRIFSGFDAIVSPVSGTAIPVSSTGTTAGTAYIIVDPGTTTDANWHALGLPLGVTPAVGAAFIAATTATVPGTGAVMTTAAAGSQIATIETVGNSNLSINPLPGSNQGFGSQFILQCRGYSGAVVTPANGTVISLAFYMSNSSIQTQGE